MEGKLSQTQPQGRWGSLAWWAEEKTGLLDPKGGLTLSEAMGGRAVAKFSVPTSAPQAP